MVAGGINERLEQVFSTHHVPPSLKLSPSRLSDPYLAVVHPHRFSQVCYVWLDHGVVPKVELCGGLSRDDVERDRLDRSLLRFYAPRRWKAPCFNPQFYPTKNSEKMLKIPEKSKKYD
eukprot:sb/3476416/